MNQNRIFYGTACFLVEKIDNESGEELASILENNGFGGTEWINLPKSGLVHVNVESMRYGYTIIGIRIASNNYDEVPNHPFTVNEFKTIWDVLKKHRINKKRVESRERKYLDSGYSCFLVKDNNLKDSGNDFWNYLNNEKFKSLNNNDTPPEWVLINVGNSTYINKSDNDYIRSYVEDNLENALDCDEFKIIWEVIRKHRK